MERYPVFLEELILLKCPYYLKQSTDLMHSLSKYSGPFSQNRTKNFLNLFIYYNYFFGCTMWHAGS